MLSSSSALRLTPTGSGALLPAVCSRAEAQQHDLPSGLGTD